MENAGASPILWICDTAQGSDHICTLNYYDRSVTERKIKTLKYTFDFVPNVNCRLRFIRKMFTTQQTIMKLISIIGPENDKIEV